MSISHTLLNLISDPDLALDLGTANTRIFALGKGLVCDRPTLIRLDSESKSSGGNGSLNPVVSDDAGTCCVEFPAPLKGGVVADIDAAASLLRPVIRRSRGFGLRPPRVLACTPTDATPQEVTALETSVKLAGASNVKVVPEPLAAAVGAGLDISSPYAQALIDIGDGVTDIAFIRSGFVIDKAAVRLACGLLPPSLRRLVASRYGVVLYSREAERVTRELGVVRACHVLGRTENALGIDRLSGRETCVTISDEEVSEAIRPIVRFMMETVRHAFRRMPERVAAEVIEGGILLTGGGACLPGMQDLISDVTGIEARVAANPLHAVINGASKMLETGAATGLWSSKASAIGL
ncbi:MAG: rod shape-determining protein [Pyrinomonadaceae bacterium]|nr:rod shape-determining protein [Pyrinomonadaceae bacterium]